MSTSKGVTIVAVFSRQPDADSAVAALRRAGFTSRELGIVRRDAQGIATTEESDITIAEDPVADTRKGANAGVVTDSGSGATIGAGVRAGVIPVIGPALFAGTLGVLASNPADGETAKGLVGALIGLGISREDATFCESEVVAGRTVVTVSSNRGDEARTILRSYGGISRQ